MRNSTKADSSAPLHSPNRRDLFVAAAVALDAQIESFVFDIQGTDHGMESALPEPFSAPIEDLYVGPLGLALFWAAMARVVPENKTKFYAAKSLMALKPVRQAIEIWLARRPSHQEEKGFHLGGTTGLGAMIYTLTCVGVWLDKPDVLHEALMLSRMITPARISEDKAFDVIQGCAGAILALVALDSAIDVSQVGNEVNSLNEKISLCAEHLFDSRVRHEGGARAWKSENSRLQAGFAHGAAGIAYSLFMAYKNTKNPRFIDAAHEAMAFERELYRPQSRNWILYPGFDESTKELMTTWCWGAPGICLSRIAALDVLDDSLAVDDIRAGIETTLAYPQTHSDHLCCGNMGRAGILSYAYQKLAGTTIVDRPVRCFVAADQLAYNVLRRAKARGRFGWSSSVHNETFDPFFFKGAAGVGYAFLHLAYPEKLPLPLLLEPPTGQR